VGGGGGGDITKSTPQSAVGQPQARSYPRPRGASIAPVTDKAVPSAIIEAKALNVINPPVPRAVSQEQPPYTGGAGMVIIKVNIISGR
jgi:hypothetical protein